MLCLEGYALFSWISFTFHFSSKIWSSLPKSGKVSFCFLLVIVSSPPEQESWHGGCPTVLNIWIFIHLSLLLCNFQYIFWTWAPVRHYPWKIECFLEDLFLGGQSSIILGYRRLSLFSLFLLVFYFRNNFNGKSPSLWHNRKGDRRSVPKSFSNHLSSGFFYCWPSS